MLTKQPRINPAGGFRLAIVIIICLVAFRLPAADIHLPALKIGTDSFTNVTVYQMTSTDIFVRHERGFGNAKISNLDDPTLQLLGLKTIMVAEKTGDSNAPNAVAVQKLKSALAAQDVKLPPNLAAALGFVSKLKPTPQLLAGALTIMVIGYLFSCFVLKKVCVNAGSEPGVMIWLPILQAFPLLRAARIPAFWFIILLIPGLNLLAHILWSLRISRACGKGTLVGVLLILPVTNIFALLYLAFSSGNEQPVERAMKPEDLPGLAGA